MSKTPQKKLEYFKRWREAHPNYKREWISKRKAAGLQTNYPKKNQARKTDPAFPCAICGMVTVLVQDHDHATGELRARLCQLCNSGLGFFRDRPELLLRASVYLQVWTKAGGGSKVDQ